MLTSLLAIAVLHWAVLVIPGFNFVLVGQLAASGSRVAAFSAVAGMTAATLGWATLAITGVGVVFTSHAVFREAVQVAGGLYLLYLAFRLWRSDRQGTVTEASVLSAPAAFRAGFMTSVLNPKIALFYGSIFATVLPQDPGLPLMALSVLLVFANSAVWHSSIALLFSRHAIQTAYLRNYQALNRVSGVVVGAYGARLISSAASEFRSRVA
ncbi:lysine transporter LysE [Marinobacter halodurans]|uniref:Lysine transporter LysE n=1 Tax=Marinobacter halodurans TaxID=2528979 RepID=A0ABY1ZE98_9GAMM|nr:LysE family transporter [Marinobacter halodurans]TBW48231.1 lysine transporter LysE [Marinobacter halodurans]